MTPRLRHGLACALAATALTGCAAADKSQPSSTTKPAASDGSASGTAGMNMAGGSSAASEVPSVNGVKPVAIRTLATSYWQDMEIQAQTMTPVPFVVYDGSGKEQLVKPPKGSSFHLMIMLTDRHTHFQIPYAGVWATIDSGDGKQIWSERQWPMISEYMGSHYGNNVPHLAPGRYTLKLLISPPVSARHLEYRHVWLKPHAVVAHFVWNPGT